LAAADKNWKGEIDHAARVIAINPLIPAPHRDLAQAAEAMGDRATAMRARRTLLLLDPLDQVEQHYHLAKLLLDERQLPAARREVVLALEEAPRYRDAHRLLLEIAGRMDAADPSGKERPATTRPAAATTTKPTGGKVDQPPQERKP